MASSPSSRFRLVFTFSTCAEIELHQWRLRSFQVDCYFFQRGVSPLVADEVIVNSMVDQALSSALKRCIAPELVHPTKLRQICEDKPEWCLPCLLFLPIYVFFAISGLVDSLISLWLCTVVHLVSIKHLEPAQVSLLDHRLATCPICFSTCFDVLAFKLEDVKIIVSRIRFQCNKTAIILLRRWRDVQNGQHPSSSTMYQALSQPHTDRKPCGGNDDSKVGGKSRTSNLVRSLCPFSAVHG